MIIVLFKVEPIENCRCCVEMGANGFLLSLGVANEGSANRRVAFRWRTKRVAFCYIDEPIGFSFHCQREKGLGPKISWVLNASVNTNRRTSVVRALSRQLISQVSLCSLCPAASSGGCLTSTKSQPGRSISARLPSPPLPPPYCLTGTLFLMALAFASICANVFCVSAGASVHV